MKSDLDFARLCVDIENWKNKNRCSNVDGRNFYVVLDMPTYYSRKREVYLSQGKPFKLTIDHFRTTMENECCFCGFKDGNNRLVLWDYEMPATFENTESSCARCASARGTQNGNEFVERCLLIAAVLNFKV
jgi:hypothetical protein